MKVVHIGAEAHGYGGATIAMLRIHRAVQTAGVDSKIVCFDSPEEPGSIKYSFPWWAKINRFVAKAITRLLYGKSLSTGLAATGLAKFVNALSPDIVHLHWVQFDMISLGEVQKITAPLVWSLHDLWSMSDTSAYPQSSWFKTGCLKGKSLADKFSWLAKKRAIHNIGKRIVAVGPSEWVTKEARESVVYRYSECQSIPYPITEALLCAARGYGSKAKNHTDRFTILFGAVGGISNEIKGWDRLVDALEMLNKSVRDRMIVQVFGGSDGPHEVHGIPVHYLGRLSEQQLVPIYHNADVFAFPSRRETWGQTKTESLCCGTPVLAFDQTACANGRVSPADDIADYACGIRYFFGRWSENDTPVLGNYCEEYSPSTIGKRWRMLYENHIRKNSPIL